MKPKNLKQKITQKSSYPANMERFWAAKSDEAWAIGSGDIELAYCNSKEVAVGLAEVLNAGAAALRKIAKEV